MATTSVTARPPCRPIWARRKSRYAGFSDSSICRNLPTPFRIEEILDYVDSVAPDNRAAKASVDIALHDLLGKIMGQPWYKIWGLSPEKAPATSFTIGIDTEEVVRQKLKEAAPYRILKIKMGLDNDKELVRIIRSETDRPICVDANQGWSSKEYALEMVEWLKEQNCLFVEQPMPKEMIDEQAWLHERASLPLIADEFLQRLPDVRRAYGLYDGINIKLMKSTGMRRSLPDGHIGPSPRHEGNGGLHDRNLVCRVGRRAAVADGRLGRPRREPAHIERPLRRHEDCRRHDFASRPSRYRRRSPLRGYEPIELHPSRCSFF